MKSSATRRAAAAAARGPAAAAAASPPPAAVAASATSVHSRHSAAYSAGRVWTRSGVDVCSSSHSAR
eukprot:145965-Chlamydomonas_euryale.AAC.8